MKPKLWQLTSAVLLCSTFLTLSITSTNTTTSKKLFDVRASAGQLMIKPLASVVLPPNTNTLGIHAVWDAVPFVDSYDFAWDTNITNVATADVIIRWSVTKPLPTLIVRSRQGVNNTSVWSEPYVLTNYVTAWTETSTNMQNWTEFLGTRVTTQTTNAMQFFRGRIGKTNNYPTLP